jgi:hypothetical protein
LKRERAQAWEPIPELLRPQNCAGHIAADGKPTVTVTERPCPEPAVWFSTATGTPACQVHKEQLERIQIQREITPP